jgi:CRP/FNR family transcriptional regulator, cyclic AMP receptor protein
VLGYKGIAGATKVSSLSQYGLAALQKLGSARRARQSPSRRYSHTGVNSHLPPNIDPRYLLQCSLEWHNRSDNTAGWELIRALRSRDRGARALAAELLANTENGRLLVRDLRRTRSGLRDIALSSDGQFCFKTQDSSETRMNTPYGLQMIEDCNTCPLKKKGWYCALSDNIARGFSECSHRTTYPGGAILFVEGQTARGALVLCSGKVKLTTTSKEGKVLIFKIAQPGDVIGLSAVISGDAYQMTAETVGPCLVNLVEREALLRLMERSGELGLRSALAVSRDLQAACRDVHDLILARSSSGKLARLLLSCASRNAVPNQPVRIYSPVTHEEMAQRIGASRETVTRLLSNLKKKDLIRLEGSTLIIQDRNALEALAV